MRRFALVVFILSVAFAVAALCAPAHATNYKHMYDWVSNRYGQAVSGVSVYVYGAGTTTAATIYSDLVGGTAASNPLTTDADGYWECYIDPATRVDVRMYKLAVALDTTISDWTYPGSVSSHAVARADTFSAVTGDTLKFRSADGQNDAYLHAKSALIPNFYTPAAHSTWFKKRGAGTGYYIMALGGTGNAPAVQFHQNTKLNWVFSNGNDYAVMGVDTTATAAAEDALEFYNYRNSDAAWGWAPKSPTYAIRFYSDIPDTAGTAKETFRIRQVGGFANVESSYLTMYDDSTERYDFRKEGLLCYPGSFVEFGSSNKYTRLGETDGTYTYLRANNKKFMVLTHAGGDSATVDAAKLWTDILKLTPHVGASKDTVGMRTGNVRWTDGDTLIIFKSDNTWGQLYP